MFYKIVHGLVTVIYSRGGGGEYSDILEVIEKDLANFQSSGETVLMGDFNAHISTRNKDYIDGDSFMPDILPASYVFDSVVKNRNAIKSPVKTDEYDNHYWTYVLPANQGF